MSKTNFVNSKTQTTSLDAPTPKAGSNGLSSASKIAKVDNYTSRANKMVQGYRNLVKCVQTSDYESGDLGLGQMLDDLENLESGPQVTQSGRQKSVGELKVEYFLGSLGMQPTTKPAMAQIPNLDKDFGKLPQDEDQLRNIRAIYAGRKRDIKALLTKLEKVLSPRWAGQMGSSELQIIQKQRDDLEKALLRCGKEIGKVDNRIILAKNATKDE